MRYKLIYKIALILAVIALAQVKNTALASTKSGNWIFSQHDAWVEVYKDKNFQGRYIRITFTDKEEMDLKRNPKYDFGDEISSIKWHLPEGWKFVLYDNDHFGGKEASFQGNGYIQEASDLHGSAYRFGDKASSFKWMESDVSRAMRNNSPKYIKDAWVIAYEDKNFRGRSIPFSEKTGEISDLKRDGNYKFGDKISSVQWAIPDGWEMVLYDNDHFNGQELSLKGNGGVQQIPDLHATPYKFGDKSSSVKWRKIQ